MTVANYPPPVSTSDPVALREALCAFFPAQYVQARPGPVGTKGDAIAFFYLDVRAIEDRLDDVFGPGNWSDDYEIALDKNIIICRLACRVAGEWVKKCGVGTHFPEHDDKMKQRDLDMAYKGAFSNSLKLAAVKWGIGRYLYDVPISWHKLDQSGKRFAADPQLPPQFLPPPNSKKAADWIVDQYEHAKSGAEIVKVDQIIKERKALDLLTREDSRRADDARGAAVRRVGEAI